MTTIAAHPTSPPTSAASDGRYVATRLPVRRFTVDEYHRMIEQGYFASDERFELLEGWIVAKMSRNPVHDAAVDIAEQLLSRLVQTGWYVRGPKAFTTSDSEPEPDIVIVRGVPRDFTARHPGPSDAAVVIEVANTTLADDRDIKLRLYARAGVASYWIINLIDRAIEVYTQPAMMNDVPSYVRRDDFVIGQTITVSIGGAIIGPIPVADFFP